MRIQLQNRTKQIVYLRQFKNIWKTIYDFRNNKSNFINEQLYPHSIIIIPTLY